MIFSSRDSYCTDDKGEGADSGEMVLWVGWSWAAARLWGELARGIEGGRQTLAAMPATGYELARRIALKQTAVAGTRTLDILHVASAILLRAEAFWTFDNRLAKVAQVEGLKLR